MSHSHHYRTQERPKISGMQSRELVPAPNSRLWEVLREQAQHEEEVFGALEIDEAMAYQLLASEDPSAQRTGQLILDLIGKTEAL